MNRTVVAAIVDSVEAAAVARTAAQLATDPGHDLVLVTAVPTGGTTELPPEPAVPERVSAALTGLDVTTRTSLVGYCHRGNARRRAESIASALVTAAQGVAAEVIVVGQGPGARPGGTSVSGQVAARSMVPVVAVDAAGRRVRPAASRLDPAPTSIPVGAPPEPTEHSELRRAARAAAGPHPSGRPLAMEDPVLTAEGRTLLEARAARLRQEIIPELAALRADDDHDRARAELARITSVLAAARNAEDQPDDPELVELGEIVTVAFEDDTVESFWLVHPHEAPLDDRRISARSPLAQALLGRRVGEEIEVQGPAAAYRCRVISARRC